MSRLSIRLFGYPQFWTDDVPIKVERRKTLALAAYLAVESPQLGISREQIADLFWPECSQEQAGAYLRQALWDFSKAAGDGWIAREEQTVFFRPQADVWVDVNAFSTQMGKWKAGDTRGASALSLLGEMAGFYQGDFLAGFNLRDCPAFDEWQVFQAETWRLRLAQVLEALTKAQFAQRSYGPAVESARRWLALDPLNEEAHQALMRLYAGQGDRGAVLRQYDALTRILEDELGVEPGPETKALLEVLRDAGSKSVPLPAPSRPVNLPAQLTPFVGREEELSRIAELLDDPNCRLISLAGMGGSGKTRLSIQAAASSRGFADGVAFVGLTAADSLEQLLPAIADTLKLAFQNEPGSNLKLKAAKGQLINFLAGKQILLVLDNFEHLASGADLLSELLDAALGLKLIVTSRERLNLRGEVVIEVGGLAFPDHFDIPDPAQFAGVQLFLKSAARAGRFVPGLADWPAIIQICRLVEGAPLGVEMAAAWTRTLSCAEIAAEIEHDLDFLQASWRGAPQRQSTFRAIFEHSWQLLSEKEQGVFCRLSIFRAGFSRFFALEVAGASLATLSNLIDKSLLRRLSSGRYEIHPVLRQYSAEKLAENPAVLAETRRRYAACYGDWLGEQFSLLKGSQQIAVLAALRLESQELLLSWQILVEAQDCARLLAGLPGAIFLNVMNDRRVEGLEFARLLLEMLSWLRSQPDANGRGAAAAYPELLALTLAAYRHFTLDFAHPERTMAYQQESLELVQNIPGQYATALVLLLNSIGPGCLTSEETLECVQKSQDIFACLGDDWGSAMAQLIQADYRAYVQKEYDLARPCYRSSLEIFDRLANPWGRGLCLNGLSRVARETGHLRESFDLGRQSLELFEQLDNQERTVEIRLSLAEVAEELNDLEGARQYHTLNRAHFLRRGEGRIAHYFQQRVALLERKRGGEHAQTGIGK